MAMRNLTPLILSLTTYPERRRPRHNPATCVACRVQRRLTPFGWILIGVSLSLGFVLGMVIGIVAKAVAP